MALFRVTIHQDIQVQADSLSKANYIAMKETGIHREGYNQAAGHYFIKTIHGQVFNIQEVK